MYGYLNLFIAAAFAWGEIQGGEGVRDSSMLLQILEERDAKSFIFHDSGLNYRGHSISTTTLRDARHALAISFGSCSFREPVDDLTALALHD
jgi:hypothetical protein